MEVYKKYFVEAFTTDKMDTLLSYEILIRKSGEVY